MIFSWRPDVFVCVCPIFNVQSPITHGLRFRYKIWYTSEAITTFSSWISSWRLIPDLWFHGILHYLKNGRGSSTFRKIRAIDLKLDINIVYRSRNFDVEFGKNRFKRLNFFEFSQNYLIQANFDLSNWNFVHKCTKTE